MDETHTLKKVMEIAKNVGRLEQVLDQKTDRIAALEDERDELRQAVGLATTAVPNMEMDSNNPIGMMHRVVAECAEANRRLEAAREAWKYVMRFVLCADAGFVEKYKQLTAALSPVSLENGDTPGKEGE